MAMRFDAGEIITAMVTPMDKDRNVDYKSLEKLVNHLIETGSDAILVAGTTGESPTLTHDEEVEIFKFVKEVVKNRCKLIMGAGSNCTKTAVMATSNAKECNADAILSVVPYYNKPSQKGLIEHFGTIADSTDLPVLLYNIPGRTGITMKPETIAQLAKDHKNIFAVKQSLPDMDVITETRRLCPDDFVIYSGDDSLTLPMVSVGAHGVISVASHIIGKQMKEMLSGCKNLTFTDTTVTIKSAVKSDTIEALDNLADELCRDYIAQSDDKANKHDMSALFKIGYGLYVVTSNDGKKDNGLIVNTVTQVSDSPNRIAVNINKQNYSHHVIKQTGKLNVNCLSVEAPFSIFERFGFQSGRTADKFADFKPLHSDNGLAFLPRYINAFISLEVENYVDLGSHGMFICKVTEARVMSDKETMTYTYYQDHVKPKPNTEGKKGWVCKICGYIYEGDTLPDDYICPLCKHGVADFEPIEN